jgi:hypothetical protein
MPLKNVLVLHNMLSSSIPAASNMTKQGPQGSQSLEIVLRLVYVVPSCNWMAV